MGTYRQPSQIIDKSLNTLNQGLQNVQQTMTAELNRRREIELKKAEAAEKKSEAFQSSRDTKVDKYKYAMSDWKTINQPKNDNWESEDVSVENQLKNNALYFLDIMSDSVEGDERYRNAELAIKNMIRDYPVFAELLNSEAQEWNKTRENPSSLIETDDPLAKTKQSMLGDIYDGKNPYRFNIQADAKGLSLKYKDGDGIDFNLRAQDFEKHVSNGYNLIDTTNNDTYNEFMEGVWGVVGQDYDPLINETKTFKDDLATGKTTTSSVTTENFRRANASVEKQIHAYVDKGAPITQNEWQLLGGKGVYKGEDDQKEFLKTALTTQQIAMNGVPNKDLIVTATSSAETRTPNQKQEENDVQAIDYKDIINDANDLTKLLKNPNRTVKGQIPLSSMTPEQRKVMPFSGAETKAKEKLEADLLKRFQGELFGTKTNEQIIQGGVVGVAENGELRYYPKINKNKELVNLPAYDNGILIDEVSLFKFQKQLDNSIKDSILVTELPPAY